MSGPVSASQVPWVNGLQDYMRKVNEAGGINGCKINVLVEDNRFDSTLDRVAYEKLVGQTPVLGISGVNDAIVANGGSAKALPIKVSAADANPQVLEIIAQKPDFVAIHGSPNTAILLMRAMQQYGVKVPAFAIAYLGVPLVYTALGPETGANYYFMSCFTPGSVDEASTGVKEMAAAADKFGHGALKDDVNYLAGYAIGQVISEAITKIGPEPTREKLVESMDKGFEVDTRGLSSQIKYTKDNHFGLVVLRPYNYDYQARRFKAYGKYSDYQKFVK